MLSTALLLAASMVVGQAGESAIGEHLEVMNCLVGDWVCEYEIDETEADSETLKQFVGQKATMKMTVALVADGRALSTDMEFNIGGKLGIKVKGLTGWDPTAKKILGYAFTNRGGCWKHTWSMVDGKLVDDYVGVNLDGATQTGQRVFVADGQNRLLMSAVKTFRNKEALPDSEFVLERK